MKKILILSLAIFGFVNLNAQEASDKKFRFGLKAVPSLSWLKLDDEKTYEKGGAMARFGYGLMTEFKISDVAWFSTGLQIDYDGGKWKSANDTSIGYFINGDNELLESEEYLLNGTADSTAIYNKYIPHTIKSRAYRSTYLTIPLALRLKTKEIGYMTYYGGFGFLASIHLKSKGDDEVINQVTGTSSNFEKIDISKDMNIMRLGLTLSGGVEINLSGSTSVLLGLTFNQFFLNNVKGDSKYNVDAEKTAEGLSATTPITVPVAQEQKFSGRNIGLIIGILF
jgi:opacity protein-like surface antigen